jgi:hypothetical protein
MDLRDAARKVERVRDRMIAEGISVPLSLSIAIDALHEALEAEKEKEATLSRRQTHFSFLSGGSKNFPF